MDIGELRRQEHLSVSQINDYMDCGLMYRFGRIERVEPEFISDGLVFGTVMHRVLEEYYAQRMMGYELEVKEVHGLFEELWQEALRREQKIRFAEGKSPESYLFEGRELLNAYFSKLSGDGFQVIGVEQGFSLSVEGIGVPVIGAIDLLEEDSSGTVVLTDWKTTGRAYSSAEIDKNLQLTVYYLALKTNGYWDREIVLKLDCLIKTKTPRFESYYTVRTDEDTARAKVKIRQVYEAIRKGVFLPNDTSWKCSGCVYQEHCKRWFSEQAKAHLQKGSV